MGNNNNNNSSSGSSSSKNSNNSNSNSNGNSTNKKDNHNNNGNSNDKTKKKKKKDGNRFGVPIVQSATTWAYSYSCVNAAPHLLCRSLYGLMLCTVVCEGILKMHACHTNMLCKTHTKMGACS